MNRTMEANSETARLVKPLFIDGNFNREGKRIRAKHVKDVSCEGATYSLWISAGSGENDYPRGENDTHYLYALVGEYLVPCGITEWKLEESAGYGRMVNDWYGSNDAREDYYDDLRKGDGWHTNDATITARLKAEEEYIQAHKNDERAQAELLKANAEHSIARYIEARDNGGKYLDFIGAAFLGEIEQCEKLAVVFRAKREEERRQKAKEWDERKRQEDAEQERKEQAAIVEAEGILRNGGKITGGDMIVKLADKYGINIPIRTRGWILNTLAECTIDGNVVLYRYWKRKAGRGSEKVYDIVGDIRKAIMA